MEKTVNSYIVLSIRHELHVYHWGARDDQAFPAPSPKPEQERSRRFRLVFLCRVRDPAGHRKSCTLISDVIITSLFGRELTM